MEALIDRLSALTDRSTAIVTGFADDFPTFKIILTEGRRGMSDEKIQASQQFATSMNDIIDQLQKAIVLIMKQNEENSDQQEPVLDNEACQYLLRLMNEALGLTKPTSVRLKCLSLIKEGTPPAAYPRALEKLRLDDTFFLIRERHDVLVPKQYPRKRRSERIRKLQHKRKRTAR